MEQFIYSLKQKQISSLFSFGFFLIFRAKEGLNNTRVEGVGPIGMVGEDVLLEEEIQLFMGQDILGIVHMTAWCSNRYRKKGWLFSILGLTSMRSESV